MIQTTVQDLLGLSNEASEKGKYSDAEKYAREILTAIEENPTVQTEDISTNKALVFIADALRLQGKIQEAKAIAEDVRVRSIQTSDVKYHANALRILGLLNLHIGSVHQALEEFHQALAIALDCDDIYEQAATLGNIGLVHLRSSDFEQAIHYFQKAIEAAQKIDKKNLEALNLNNLGTVHENLSQYKVAMEYYSQAMTIAIESQKIPLQCTILGNMANTCRNLSDYERALAFNQQALELAEKAEISENISTLLSGLANVYDDIGDQDRALEYHQKALAIDTKQNNKQAISTSLFNIANIHYDRKDFDKALELYLLSLAIVEEIGNKAGIARRLSNIANIYYDLHQYDRALENFFKALDLAEVLKLQSLEAGIIFNIGCMYANSTIEVFDDSKAEEYLQLALSKQIELGTKRSIYMSYKELSNLYEVRKEWEKSHDYFKKFYELEQEVQSRQAKEQAELYAVERKTAEYEKESAVQKEREKILDNILPKGITERLLKGEQPIADHAEAVSVFFSDIVDFTEVTQRISAKELVGGLNDLFKQFDTIALKHGIEKIKTIGDAYMAVCGLPIPKDDHARRMTDFALDIKELCSSDVSIGANRIRIRIGLHCGEVIAGVIGDQKFAYDLWGDAVNTASRMESHGVAGKIHVSEEFMKAYTSDVVGTSRGLSIESGLSRSSLKFVERGELDIKGKGMMKTYFLEKV